ncbi:MAG: twin-arginine translocation signal domain-containing protein [Steroidobacteraceae bacterium]|nr:twin-arginine translocation signal domain-containing protein [Steroidobacteraceae bacterium]
MTEPTRREFLQAGATAVLAAAATAGSSPSSAAEEKLVAGSGDAFRHRHSPVPLPFNAKSLKGLSEKLIQSHWENNYGGAVKALNTVRSRLSQALNDANTPPYIYNGLKREQLIRTGSVVLHELYFANLGGDGKAPADLRSRIAAAFGTYDAWESEFRKIGEGLGGGSGWVVLGYNRALKVLENYWMADHSTNPPETTPILVMDMYEHAYQMDYGAAAAKYIDAFFANIQWDAVAKRMAQT